MLDTAETAALRKLRELVARLRAPDGWPWDREQTHTSRQPFLIEEAYEVVAALDAGDEDALPEELGDLLFQILLHTQMAEEQGNFTMAEVLESLAAKLIRRHPHVFADAVAEDSEQVLKQWGELKRGEREPSQSALHGVPGAMPALAYAQSLLARAEKAGFAWPDRRDVIAKIEEELAELEQARTAAEAKAEFGDLLLNLANYARYMNIDAEEALREAGHKFRRRFSAVESGARETGRELSALDREQLLELWQQAKTAGL